MFHDSLLRGHLDYNPIFATVTVVEHYIPHFVSQPRQSAIEKEEANKTFVQQTSLGEGNSLAYPVFKKLQFSPDTITNL